LPNLHRLEFEEAFEQPPDMVRIFEALAVDPKVAFPRLRELEYRGPSNTDVTSLQALTSTLAKGGFPDLDTLLFFRSGMSEERMVALLEGIYAFECGGGGGGNMCREIRLRTLALQECEISAGGIKAIANVIEKGGLASLRELTVVTLDMIEEEEGRSFVPLAQALERSGHSSLRKLVLKGLGLNDADIEAFVSAAMSEGECLRNVSTLVVDGSETITDVGAFALAKAIGEGRMPYLFEFDMSFTGIKESGAAALVSAIMCNCDEIERIHMPEIEEAGQRAIRGIVLHNARGEKPSLYYV
jgi:hypothetical protein